MSAENIMKKRPTQLDILKAAKSQPTMAAAAKSLGIPFSTFKRRALALNVYEPNQGAKGCPGSPSYKKISLKDILAGKHPAYQTDKLRRRLIKENKWAEKCELCGLSEWMGKKIPLVLDHINGTGNDHRLENLRLLCRNCDGQLDTFAGRNKART